MSPDLPSIVNHIFVDFENVQKIDSTVIGGKNVRLTLLVGPLGKKVDMNVFEEALQHASKFDLVRLTSSGRNALDFALAYYVGRAAVGDPRGRFHIISKDKGFDPLVEHLQSRGIHALRHDSFTTLRLSRPVTAKVPPPSPPRAKPKPTAKARVSPPRQVEPAARALAHLRKLSSNKRPKKRTSLVSYLHTHLGKKIAEDKVEAIVKALEDQAKIKSDGRGAVTYDLE